jgi:hypothetical protein
MPLSADALRFTFHCDAPARCGALADRRCVALGDKGGRVYVLLLKEPRSRSRYPPFDPVRSDMMVGTR